MTTPGPQKKSLLKKLNKPLASLRLAVFIIICIAVITAVGTIIEAKYDAYAAKKLVYDTWMMYTIMGLLAINLIGVMIDRLPWKKRHASFVLAHIGILVLLLGALITAKYGLDGSMRVGIGDSNTFVQTSETDLVVYSSFDGDRYSKTFESEVDFFRKPPSEQKPLEIPAVEGSIKVVDYKKYVLPSRKVVVDESGKAGAGLRFQIQNPNVNVIEWLVQRKPNAVATHNFGPAQVHLGPIPEKGFMRNEIYLSPEKGPKDEWRLRYAVFYKESDKPGKKGFLKEGDVFDPGFKMAMEFRVLRFMPSAVEDWDLQTLEQPTPLTTSAVKIAFEGKEHWVLLNDMVKLFTNNSVYLLTYGNRRIDIGFPLKLKSFEVDRYQGTTRAMAYKSIVEVPELGEHVISMNEPLKYKGLTIYQASFQEENGQPVASIFSVNADPGRFIKYLGSLIMTLGVILLMWFKHLDFKIGKKAGVKPDVKGEKK
ncbi:cytochrome c biogenesis protein ResB [Bdellovibrio svalbardensis]|uniref:Cytochrome c biogenesis protein ResB n=1 Tax=Bdellovibrio svalbardensis TaxID=2972972 RepID=A0ABT6DMV7_9BACT|nr:cytochrome c biogenesis protein ResB [Bdellovibrio svalbardensis]MDG0817430.1 cytochrome c biogenesis protein ResB [Bdellovibrio svalbardensis]